MPLGSHPGTMGELATAAARGMIDAVEIGPDARKGGGGVDASAAGDLDQGGGRECTATPTGGPIRPIATGRERRPRDRGQSPILREAIQRDSHIREILIFSIRNLGRVGLATTGKCDG
jgi:hypothetical protein